MTGICNESVFFTVVYPQALPYFKELCYCARNQTRKDFDVVVVNDGCDATVLKAQLKGLKSIIIDSVGTIAGNRLAGIEYARKKLYKYLFFCDADDTFSSRRMERSINEFEASEADVVVCNLNVVDEKCEPIIKDYFSQEIPLSRWIDVDFIEKKNILGMSNTAVLVSSIPDDIIVPNIPIVDWYLFTILLHRGLKTRYITDSLVNYRQYNSNMIGITNYDIPTFRKLAEYKKNHYQMLVENGYTQYQDLYEKSDELVCLSDDEIRDVLNRKMREHKQPLWWQIIEQ